MGLQSRELSHHTCLGLCLVLIFHTINIYSFLTSFIFFFKDSVFLEQF